VIYESSKYIVLICREYDNVNNEELEKGYGQEA
jgi:hypothetical protein